jgi:hypothetical protein
MDNRQYATGNRQYAYAAAAWSGCIPVYAVRGFGLDGVGRSSHWSLEPRWLRAPLLWHWHWTKRPTRRPFRAWRLASA